MFGFYPNERNRTAFYQSVADEFPFVKKEVIGTSLVGREIASFTVGNLDKRVIIAAAFHGSEWLTANIALHFLWDLCCCIKNSEPIGGLHLGSRLKKRGISIVPCVNPDGVEINLSGADSAGRYSALINSLTHEPYRWQANARGVDLNHNFPANWEVIHRREQDMGITKPSSTRYGGERPASEPETVALMNYINENNFTRAYALHSQGREIYYSFGKNTPKPSNTMSRVLSIASGYKTAKPPLIADGGGFKDWFIEKFHQPGFTFEIGVGENPLPLTDESREYAQLLKALCLTTII